MDLRLPSLFVEQRYCYLGEEPRTIHVPSKLSRAGSETGPRGQETKWSIAMYLCRARRNLVFPQQTKPFHSIFAFFALLEMFLAFLVAGSCFPYLNRV